MATPTPARPKVYELSKFAMFSEVPGTNTRSKLAWCIRDGFPRISVYTNIADDKTNYGIIAAPMNPETFLIFLNNLEHLTKAEAGTTLKLDCFTSVRDAAGNATKERKIQSEVHYGKDPNGILWISVVAPERPKITFEFIANDWHKFYKQDGTVLNKSEGSILQTLAAVAALKNIYYRLFGDFRQYGAAKTDSAPQSSLPEDLTTDIPF